MSPSHRPVRNSNHEDHRPRRAFFVPDVLHAWQSLDPRWQDLAVKPSSEGEGGRRLLEFGPERIAIMDDESIDVQVLSLTSPGVQSLKADPLSRDDAFHLERLAEGVISVSDCPPSSVANSFVGVLQFGPVVHVSPEALSHPLS